MDPKDGINPNWSAFYFSNSRVPLKSISVNGFEMQRAEFNFWVHSTPLGSAPYKIVLTAQDGEKLDVTVNDMIKSQDLKVQFGGAGLTQLLPATEAPKPAAAG